MVLEAEAEAPAQDRDATVKLAEARVHSSMLGGSLHIRGYTVLLDVLVRPKQKRRRRIETPSWSWPRRVSI